MTFRATLLPNNDETNLVGGELALVGGATIVGRKTFRGNLNKVSRSALTLNFDAGSGVCTAKRSGSSSVALERPNEQSRQLDSNDVALAHGDVLVLLEGNEDNPRLELRLTLSAAPAAAPAQPPAAAPALAPAPAPAPAPAAAITTTAPAPAPAPASNKRPLPAAASEASAPPAKRRPPTSAGAGSSADAPTAEETEAAAVGGAFRAFLAQKRQVLATAAPRPADAGWPQYDGADAVAVALSLADGALHARAADGRGAVHGTRAPLECGWDSLPAGAEVRRCELAQDISDGHRWLLRLATTRGEPLTLRLEELTAAPLLGGGGGGATDALGVAAAAARDDGGPLGGVAGTLKGCGEVVGKLLDRVATLRRLCNARDASLDAKEATLNAREAELGVEVERLREGEAGLLADFLPLLERKRERLAELEKEVLDRRCEHYVHTGSTTEDGDE